MFIDTDGATDRLLEFTAQVDGLGAVMMGDAVTAPAGRELRFDMHVTHAAGASIRLIMDAREVKPLRDASIVSDDAKRGFTWQSEVKPHWICVEVRDARKHLMLLGNPIYLNWWSARPGCS